MVESLYKDLIETGYSFEIAADKNSASKTVPFSNDPNMVFTEEEEADIAKGIFLNFILLLCIFSDCTFFKRFKK